MLPRLSDIAPKWAQALEKHRLSYYINHDRVKIDGRELALGVPECCIVGEAWNFREPRCSTCFMFSQGLYFRHTDGAGGDTERFIKQFKTDKDMINAFVVHFIEEHRK